MNNFFLLMIIFFMGLLLIYSSPLWLIGGLVVQTLLICLLKSGTKELWLLYIFFLVFLGGLLIIFVYSSSVIPNLMPEYKLKELELSGLLVMSVSVLCCMKKMESVKVEEESGLFFYKWDKLMSGVTSLLGSILYLYLIFFYC